MVKNICINGIICSFKEYRCNGNKWKKVEDSFYYVDSTFINNMIESSPYFSSLGGTMNIYSSKNRRFGEVPAKIVSVSICGAIKKVFSFNYNQAQVI